MAEHGDTVAGKKIEIIRKDSGGPNPDVAKRLAQELVVRDKVDILAGFALTPEALGAADVATEAGKLMVVMNAATSVVTEKSPMIVRTSVTIPQLNYPFGKWAFTDGGVHRPTRWSPTTAPASTPSSPSPRASPRPAAASSAPTAPRSQNPDFSAFVQRVKDANPEAVYIFVPGGGQPAAIGKALADRGLTPPATKVLGQGELTHPEALESMGENARGIITTYHYVLERDDPLNNAFVEGYRAANAGRSPDLFSIGGYDGMHLIYAALEKTGAAWSSVVHDGEEVPA